MEVLTKPVLLLGLAMILALIIERLVELIKGILYHLEAHADASKRWTQRAERVRNRLEVRLDQCKAGDQQGFDLIMALASRYLSESDPAQGGLMAVSADKLRTMTLKGWLKSLSIVMGIAAAFVFEIDILVLVELAMQETDKPASYEPQFFGTLLAGVSMGLGAGPIHKMITALEEARELRRKARGL